MNILMMQFTGSDMQMKKAMFLDRDGTLIEDKGYEYQVESLKIYPGVIEGLELLKDEYVFFIITNQSGIGKGFYTAEDFHRFNNALLEQLNARDIRIERTYFCPHTGGCECRKPGTKFIDEIMSEFDIHLAESWVIGDHPSDVMLGKNAGCQTVFLLTGHGTKHIHELESQGIEPTFITEDFLSAATRIKSSIG